MRRCHPLLLALVALGAQAQSQVPPSQRYALSAPDPRLIEQVAGVDRAAALAADRALPKSAPLRYARTRTLGDAAVDHGRAHAGEWRTLSDGKMLWRLPVRAAGAISLDFGFAHLFLPHGAQLFISNDAARLGPYDDSDNPHNGTFWTPLLPGDDALIEVLLPAHMKPFLSLDLRTVHVGYRDFLHVGPHAKSFFDPNEGSGACNIDTICPQADPWRDAVDAEAVVVDNGSFCSGQLLNDTPGDHAPLLSTANHCLATQSDADSLIVYWKYESPVCRAIGSAANGQPVPTNNAIPQTGGATLLATYQPADFTLVRLRKAPPAAASAYWNGWDRSETPFSGAVVLHHAESDAKRISFSAGTITLDDINYGQDQVPGLHHWRVDHYSLGTTQAGSSGSGLIDAAHRLRGVLSGGSADCSVPDGDDFYGRLSTAWNGGGTAATRLRDWLDPVGSGAEQIDGSGACDAPSVSLGSSENPASAGDRVTLSATATGGVPPYTYAFDVDGDGVADSLDPHAASVATEYPAAFSGNVRVTVTDSTGCSGSASTALVVLAQDTVAVPDGNGQFAATRICGGGGSQLQPGQRWKTQVSVRNDGNAPVHGGYAVFAQETAGSPAPATLTLETPAVALPALAPGESAPVTLTYAISPDATCGAAVRIDYLGSADDNGFAANRTRVVDGQLATGAQCQPQACVAQLSPVALHTGNFYNPQRPGNGMTTVLTPVTGADPIFFGAWFSGDAQRRPTWYVVNDALHGNQVNAVLYLTHQDAADQFPVSGSAVGDAQISLVSADRFVFTWTLDGTPGGAVYVPVVDDSARSVRAWFNPAESGWGTFDELFPAAGSNGLPFAFNLAYVYDAAGNPRWTVASDAAYRDGNTLTAMAVHPACPGCVWLDYTLNPDTVGTLRYHFTSATSGTISTDLTLPAADSGTWMREALPIIPLVPPQQ